MPGLFDSFTLKEITLRNRIAASPMCQYQAENGLITDWHMPHYAALARGGAGLVVVEATAVSAAGRITLGDLGLWSDAHIEGVAAVAKAIADAGAVPGIQLGHAGRKAGCAPPWEGGEPLASNSPQAWQPVAPSAVPLVAEHPHVPRALSREEIHEIQQDFVNAARRALAAGFQWLELHFAHGFLAQSFLSPHSNQREDTYGGSVENRSRFLIETVAAVRRVWPARLPLTARLGVLEFDGHDDVNLPEAIQVLQWLKSEGLDLVDVGIGFSTQAPVPWAPNLLVNTAASVAQDTGLKVTTSWQITDAVDADRAIRDNKVDFVMVARGLLDNPHWPRQAARALGVVDRVLPTPYAYWLQNWAPQAQSISPHTLKEPA